MSISKAAKLVLSLKDEVSGPARRIRQAMNGVNTAVANIGGAVGAPAKALGRSARSMRRSASDMTVASGGLSLGLGLAARSVYQLEDTLNEIEGRRFGKRDIFHLADGTEMSREAFRESARNLISEINKNSPRTASEIGKAYNQLVQAGLSHEQVEAVLPMSINFAIAGNYDTEEAADKLTNVMTAMRLPMATYEDAVHSAKRASDVIAYATNETNSTVAQMTEAFKYAAPSAAALGIDIEQLAAMFVIQARRGIKASEAGVSIRSMLTRMVRPTKMAQASLARYNLDLADYLEKTKEVSGTDVSQALSFGGLDASAAQAEIDKILASSVSTAEKVQSITKAVMDSVGDASTMSAEQISDVVSEVLFSFGEKLDVETLIADMQKAGIAMSDFFRIFDVRQGARLLSLFGDDLSGWTQNIRESSEGFTEALRETRMQGLVGAVQRFSAAMVDLFQAAAHSGVMDRVSGGISKTAEAIIRLSKVNPRLMEFGTYSLLAVAAIAPLGFAFSGLASAASLVVNPLTWVAAGLATLVGMNFGSITKGLGEFGSTLTNSLNAAATSRFGEFANGLKAAARQLAEFGDNGASIAASARSWGQSVAETLNRISSAVTDLANTKFVTSFFSSLKTAAENSTWAARQLVDSLAGVQAELQPVMDFLNTEFSGRLGDIAGQMFGYGLTFAAASFLIGMVAKPVRKVAKAIAYLSGLKLAWGVLKFLGRLAGIAGSAAAISSLGSGVGKVGKGLGALSRLGIFGAAAGAAAGTGYVLNKMGADNQAEARRMATHRDAERQSMAALKADADAVQDEIDRAMAASEQRAAQAGQNMEDSLNITATPQVNTSPLERALNLARNVLSVIKKIDSAAAAASGPAFTVKGVGGDSGSSDGEVAGKRAYGGPVKKSLTYQVGENGVELFTPDQNGRILSNQQTRRAMEGNRAAPAVNITNHFTLSGGSTKANVEEAFRKMDRQLERSARILFGGSAIYGD